MISTLAGRFEWLMDLYAPRVYNEDDECIGRDPSLGVISLDDVLRLLEMPAQAASSSGSSSSG